jgi:7-keto-8-aminopelargonate synthetase-like enzyme
MNNSHKPEAISATKPTPVITNMELPEPLQQVDRTYVRVNGRKLSYFAGCDYFRLASHPQVSKAAAVTLKKFGLNVAASRMTTGNHEIYGKLEIALSEFFGAETAVLISNGYATNLIAMQALTGEFTHGLIDEKAHPSLKDAARMLGCPVMRFRHRDAQDAARVIREAGESARLILMTDGMFAHDGQIAPLRKYIQSLPGNAWMLVDDSHGAGTLGKTGKGSIELENIARDRVVQCVTLSKAFGAYGGAILGPSEIRQKIFTRSGMFVGSTPLPLPLAGAACKAVEILKAKPKLRRQLNENTAYVRKKLQQGGVTSCEVPGPIFPILPKSVEHADALQQHCFRNGVFPSFIRYPGGPPTGYFRFVISSEHTRRQLDALVRSIVETAKNFT